MECKVFKKKITDLLEDNISYDLKDAMLKHMENCEECRDLYDDERFIDEQFRSALKVEPQSFRSLRSDIMKNIDKNKYGKSPMKRLILHFKKHTKTYSAAAAFIVFAAVFGPYAIKGGFGYGNKSGSSAENQSTVMESASARKANIAEDNSGQKNESFSIQSEEDTRDESSAKDTVKSEIKSSEKADASYMPIFEKKELAKDFKPVFNTPWESSPSKKYSVTIEGRGDAAQEEGIGAIILNDSSTGKQWSFNMTDNAEKQYTPKAIKWITDESLLVIVGYGYGTVSPGGQLYILNINSAQTLIADPLNTAKLDEKAHSQISKILSVRYSETKPLEIDVEVTIYDDENLVNSHTETRTITSYIPPFN